MFPVLLRIGPVEESWKRLDVGEVLRGKEQVLLGLSSFVMEEVRKGALGEGGGVDGKRREEASEELEIREEAAVEDLEIEGLRVVAVRGGVEREFREELEVLGFEEKGERRREN